MRAYSIFKRPDLIDKGEPFLEAVLGIPGAGHYTPNLAQEINLSRIQRYPSVRGCFDGGACALKANLELSRTQHYAGLEALCESLSSCKPDRISRVRATFKAPSGRQLIADKGSSDGGSISIWRPEGTRVCRRVRFRVLAQRTNRERIERRLQKRTTFRAALPERCFRYLDCFGGASGSSGYRIAGFVLRRACQLEAMGLLETRAPTKTVSIPSSLDRNLKDNQGGCLYEWSGVRNYDWWSDEARCSGNNALMSGLDKSSQVCWPEQHGHENRLEVRYLAPITYWQKPGIGIAAVSPVPKREFRKGEGPDYPYLQDTVRGKAITMEKIDQTGQERG